METETFDLAQQPVCELYRLEETNLNTKRCPESQLRPLPRFANREASSTQIRTESVELHIFNIEKQL